jgi:hypothetical protein
MLKSLRILFNKVIVVQNCFYSPSSALDDIKHIKNCLKKVKTLKNERFDNIYMSQERIFDLILCTRAKKNNPKALCFNIEEDAYYSINNKYNDDNFVYTESSRATRRKFLYSLLLFRYPYNYRYINYFYGASKEYHGAKLLFPRLARKELQGKELQEITKQDLLTGISAIYSENKTDLPQSDKYVLFFFDLMNRYKNPENVKSIVMEIIKEAKENGRTVLFKYHPRETDKYEGIEDTFEIPNLIPAEKVLMDLQGKDVIVTGNATTSCIVSAKLGYKVISICKLEFPENKKMHSVMSKMGITCIENLNDIKILFNKL